MQLTFGNMTLELNIFHLKKKHMPLIDEDREEVCMIDTILDEQSQLQQLHEEWVEEPVELSEALQEDPELCAGYRSWRRKEEILPLLIGDGGENDGSTEHQKLDLKPLPVELKYAHLEEEEQCPLVIFALLNASQEGSLLDILRKNKQTIGWKKFYPKGISPLVCTHHIFLGAGGSKPVRQPQRRLNPHMQEGVCAGVLKLMQAGIIYPISDSPWVSLTQVVPKKYGVTIVQSERGEDVPSLPQVGGYA